MEQYIPLIAIYLISVAYIYHETMYSIICSHVKLSADFEKTYKYQVCLELLRANSD